MCLFVCGVSVDVFAILSGKARSSQNAQAVDINMSNRDNFGITVAARDPPVSGRLVCAASGTCRGRQKYDNCFGSDHRKVNASDGGVLATGGDRTLPAHCRGGGAASKEEDGRPLEGAVGREAERSGEGGGGGGRRPEGGPPAAELLPDRHEAGLREDPAALGAQAAAAQEGVQGGRVELVAAVPLEEVVDQHDPLGVVRVVRAGLQRSEPVERCHRVAVAVEVLHAGRRARLAFEDAHDQREPGGLCGEHLVGPSFRRPVQQQPVRARCHGVGPLPVRDAQAAACLEVSGGLSLMGAWGVL